MLNKIKRAVDANHKNGKDTSGMDMRNDYQVISLDIPTEHIIKLIGGTNQKNFGSDYPDTMCGLHTVIFGDDNGIYFDVLNHNRTNPIGRRVWDETIPDDLDGGGFSIFIPKRMTSSYKSFQIEMLQMKLIGQDERIKNLRSKNIHAKKNKSDKTYLIIGYDMCGLWIKGELFRLDSIIKEYGLGKPLWREPTKVSHNVRLGAGGFSKILREAGKAGKNNTEKGALYTIVTPDAMALVGYTHGGTKILMPTHHSNYILGVGIEEGSEHFTNVIPHEYYHKLLFKDLLNRNELKNAFVDLGRTSLGKQYVGCGVTSGPRKGLYFRILIRELGYGDETWADYVQNRMDVPRGILKITTEWKIKGKFKALWPDAYVAPEHTLFRERTEEEMDNNEKEMVAAWYNEWIMAKIRSGEAIPAEAEELAHRLGLLTGE